MSTTINLGSVDAGESADITAVLYDADGGLLNKLAIESLTVTIKDENETIINGRSSQSILDENGGTRATDGTLTFKLSELDNVFLSPYGLTSEWHLVQLAWTWVDDSLLTRTGKQNFKIRVRAFTR